MNTIGSGFPLTTVTVLGSDRIYAGSMSQNTRNHQFWAYRLSVALDSLYPIQPDFLEPPSEE